ncbi:substrate-binding periplasmic protein [Marinobacter sp. SS21]|uniref:substrate-binding periplasmic protein n=1 Tax=Marinobacter sp. SS21 TaxID=2979460 RepID=UPI00232B3A76|nr:transporter substrate-binding domain-containing protein [Marinobacter sp. SS21]MDC0661495.1 transporter substrate-binding domain-containing protein [Marinobacter sp. SS21]
MKAAKYGIAVAVLLAILPLMASAELFIGHCRDRLPELNPLGMRCAGPGAEVIERALAYTGHQVEWVSVPWARTLYMAQRGAVDILPVHSMALARESYLLPIHYGSRSRSVYYFARAASTIRVASFDDLFQYRIGALRESFYSEQFNTAQGLDVFYATEPDQLINMLLHNRLDVVVTSSFHEPDLYFSNPRLTQLEYVEYFVNERYFSIPLASPMARHYQDIQQVVRLMRDRGEINEIYRLHGVPAPSRNPPLEP